MPTLVLHAPEHQLGRKDTKSFIDTFNTQIGKAYALNSKIHCQITFDCRVVLLCKDKQLRADGELDKLIPATTEDGRLWITGNGIQRYDIYVKNFELVDYKPEKLNRNGVAII